MVVGESLGAPRSNSKFGGELRIHDAANVEKDWTEPSFPPIELGDKPSGADNVSCEWAGPGPSSASPIGQ